MARALFWCSRPASVLAALLVGGTLGLMAGYFGGLIDEVSDALSRRDDGLPADSVVSGHHRGAGASAINIVLAISIAGAPGIARLVRSLTLDIKTRDYIAAAQTRGESPWYIMFVEILPNARGPIMIDAMLRVGYAVFAIGTLGFLGPGSAAALARLGQHRQRRAQVHPGRAYLGCDVGLAGHGIAGGWPESVGRWLAGRVESISMNFRSGGFSRFVTPMTI